MAPGGSKTARIAGVLASLVACSALVGCTIAGYSNNGDEDIWPAALGLIFLLLVLLWFLLRRR